MSESSYEPLFISDEEVAQHVAQKGAQFVDAYGRQLKELFFIVHREFIGGDKAAVCASPQYTSFCDEKKGSHVHVYYPWLNTVVKTVGKNDYLALKTNRNQDLITETEQAKLRDFTVGVFGLSVGSNVAFTLTQAGISNSIVIADFDELDTTNLNRIFAGVHQVGLNKSVIAARRIYEDNPFANIEVHPEGVNDALLRSLLEEKKLDCIVDEVDDMPFKIACRNLAMQFGVPVVMVTDNGDGVVLHIERYDLGLKTIFGKEPSYFAQYLSGKLTREQAGKMIMEDIVGGMDKVDPAMLLSVKRVLDKELVSWSQLGSAAILGGVAATYAVKQIALKRSHDMDIRAHIAPSAVSWGSHTA